MSLRIGRGAIRFAERAEFDCEQAQQQGGLAFLAALLAAFPAAFLAAFLAAKAVDTGDVGHVCLVL
ncbi:MAG: hypothetical protein R6W83_05060 [Cryobacterium sp.]